MRNHKKGKSGKPVKHPTPDTSFKKGEDSKAKEESTKDNATEKDARKENPDCIVYCNTESKSTRRLQHSNIYRARTEDFRAKSLK